MYREAQVFLLYRGCLAFPVLPDHQVYLAVRAYQSPEIHLCLGNRHDLADQVFLEVPCRLQISNT